MFKRQKLPPGYTIQAEQPTKGYGNFLTLRDSTSRLLATEDLDLSSVWGATRKLLKIAWADHKGRR